MLLPRAAEIVRDQGVNAEWAVQQVFEEFSGVFDDVADPYLMPSDNYRWNGRSSVEDPPWMT